MTIDEMTRTVPVPEVLNIGPDGPLRSAKQATMLTLLGNPRVDLTADCQPVANPTLKTLMVTESVGPFRVTGLRPAVASLRAVMAQIARDQPDIHAALGSAGMLCVRHVRGIPDAISNHAWGSAIDLTIGGVLDRFNDGVVQVGLTLIAPIFNAHGWFWGAPFSREDGMHFECSDGLVRAWAQAGELGAAPVGRAPAGRVLTRGDRGEEVRLLQETLNLEGAGLLADQVFGRDTQTAVMRFQSAHGLAVDGVVGAPTWKKLDKLRTDRGLPPIGG